LPVYFARIDAARFDRDAPSFSWHVAASIRAAPAAGHAPSALSGGVPLPRCGSRGLVGFLSAAKRS